MTTEHNIITTSQAPQAVGPYCQGVQYNGIYYFSGQIGLDPQTGQMAQGFTPQAQQILHNIDGLLKACQLTRQHILKTTIFLTDIEQFATINQLYQDYFTPPYPARSCLEVSKLPKSALVEIEVIARQI